MAPREGAAPVVATTTPGANQNDAVGNASSGAPIEQTSQSPKKSWRDVLRVHPAAEMFPLMSPEELRNTASDIERHGLKIPVALLIEPNGEESLLDGRNRLDAMPIKRPVLSSHDGPTCNCISSENNTVGSLPVVRLRNIDPYA